MKKETFINLMKVCIHHVEQAESMGKELKNLISKRSTLTDFMDGFDTIFYDDQMIETIIKTLESELGDKNELLTTWFYEYRTMNISNDPFTVSLRESCGIIEWNIGVDPLEDEQNLSTLYDAITHGK